MTLASPGPVFKPPTRGVPICSQVCCLSVGEPMVRQVQFGLVPQSNVYHLFKLMSYALSCFLSYFKNAWRNQQNIEVNTRRSKARHRQHQNWL